MSAQEVNVVPLSTTKTHYSFDSSHYLNLPDLQFFAWCNQKYQINRGVYNTIEQWFYDYGVVHIHNRRIQMLAFLEFVTEERHGQIQEKILRFGHGGLTKKLNEFINN
ncbi:hypothetical protein [Neobacillus sp. LXY-1]|uniref:hypothetical protein n=1 Tax=Neobacillus sp. LXY-1 TaxID=3379133 RepID=UPI003EE13CD0